MRSFGSFGSRVDVPKTISCCCVAHFELILTTAQLYRLVVSIRTGTFLKSGHLVLGYQTHALLYKKTKDKYVIERKFYAK